MIYVIFQDFDINTQGRKDANSYQKDDFSCQVLKSRMLLLSKETTKKTGNFVDFKKDLLQTLIEIKNPNLNYKRKFKVIKLTKMQVHKYS